MKTAEEQIRENRQHIFNLWIEDKISDEEYYKRMEETRKDGE